MVFDDVADLSDRRFPDLGLDDCVNKAIGLDRDAAAVAVVSGGAGEIVLIAGVGGEIFPGRGTLAEFAELVDRRLAVVVEIRRVGFDQDNFGLGGGREFIDMSAVISPLIVRADIDLRNDLAKIIKLLKVLAELVLFLILKFLAGGVGADTGDLLRPPCFADLMLAPWAVRTLAS